MTKLEERRAKYGIPDAPCLPQGKKVVVFRLPLQEKTAGGLYIPEEHANPEPMGVLIAAGLAARDVMRDALIEIGDIVMLPRFTTNSPEVSRNSAEKGKHVELLNIEDLVGSVDGLGRLEKEYEIKIFVTDDGAEHRYVPRASGEMIETDLTIAELAAGKKPPGMVFDMARTPMLMKPQGKSAKGRSA